MKRFLILSCVVLVVIIIVLIPIRNVRVDSGPELEKRRTISSVRNVVSIIKEYEQKKGNLPENLESTREVWGDDPLLIDVLDRVKERGVTYKKIDGKFRYQVCGPYLEKSLGLMNLWGENWSLSNGVACLSIK